MRLKKYWECLVALVIMLLFVFALGACTPDVPLTDIPDDPSTEIPVEKPEPEKPKPKPGEKAEFYAYTPTIAEKMPTITITTDNGSNDWVTKYGQQDKIAGRIDYVSGKLSVSNCESKYEIANAVTEVKVRGNYTLEYEKKPIRIKLDKKQSMLGLNNDQAFKSWVLLADWKDLAALNNATSFYLGKTILGSDGFYSSDYRHVEVYLNGQYWGVYLLCEQQQSNAGRTTIAEPAADYKGTDIGYLIEYDGYYTQENVALGGDYTFTLNHSGQNGYSIKSDIFSTAQVSFIQSYMNNVYKIATNALNGRYYKFNSTYTDTVTTTASSAKEVISQVIDIQSLVDTYVLNEIACDPDIAWSSFYMDVDMSTSGDKRLTFEAPWDFDSAFGIRSGYVNNSQGMYAANSSNVWLNLLVSQQWFKEMVIEKWSELIEYDVLQKSLDYIAGYSDTLGQYFIQNNERWSRRVSNGNGEVTSELNGFKDVNTAQKKASEVLVRWLTARYKYLDGQWGDGGALKPDAPVDSGVDETVPAGAVAYRYEAENAAFTGGISTRLEKDGQQIYNSSNGYVGNVAGGAGRTITFTVNSPSATSAYLYFGLSKRTAPALIEAWFSVTVNGAVQKMPVRTVPAISGGESDFHAFISLKMMLVPLKQGQNSIVLTTVGSDATNFDYIDLYSTVNLT